MYCLNNLGQFMGTVGFTYCFVKSYYVNLAVTLFKRHTGVVLPANAMTKDDEICSYTNNSTK